MTCNNEHVTLPSFRFFSSTSNALKTSNSSKTLNLWEKYSLNKKPSRTAPKNLNGSDCDHLHYHNLYSTISYSLILHGLNQYFKYMKSFIKLIKICRKIEWRRYLKSMMEFDWATLISRLIKSYELSYPIESLSYFIFHSRLNIFQINFHFEVWSRILFVCWTFWLIVWKATNLKKGLFDFWDS